MADTIDEMIAVAREAREHPDPWQGFSAFAEKYALLRSTNCGLNERPLDAHQMLTPSSS